jgi:general secretion pathway protein I
VPKCYCDTISQGERNIEANFLGNEMKEKGFTLLEVMVALAILSIALVVLFSQQATSLSRGNEARIITKATLLAQEQMSGLLAEDRWRIGIEEGEVKESIPPFKWRQQVEEGDIEGMKRITVVILWKEGEKEREVRFVTYVASQ